MEIAFATGIFAFAGGVLCLMAQKARRDTMTRCETLKEEFAATIAAVRADHGRLVELLRAARERARSAEAERANALRDRDFAVAELNRAVRALEDFCDVPEAREAALADIRKGLESLRLACTPTS
jgi:hypothetical protein